MRYKPLALNKIEELEAILNRLEFDVNRNQSREQALATLDVFKGKLDELRSLINVEHDNFEEQFKSY